MRKVGNKENKLSDKIKFEKYTVKYDAFDIRNFQSIKSKNLKLTKTYNEGIDTYPQFEELQQDVFDGLFKYNPELLDPNRVDVGYKLNQKVMESVLQSPKYKELRILTRMNKVHSTVGTEVLGEEVKNLVQELQEQFKDALDKVQQAQKEMGDTENQSNSKQNKEQGEGQEGQEGKAQEAITKEEAKKALEKAMEELEKEVDKIQQRKVNSMMDRTIAETQEASDMITNWGLEQDPNYEMKSHQEKIKLLDTLRNSRKLKELALLAGRYRRLAISSRKEKIKKGSEELFDTTYGDDIGRILPTEMLRLLDPDLETLFKRDLFEKQLLQYEYKGNEKKSKGPIVCCLDGSGSMNGPAEIWGKSVALGLLEVAKGQNRSFAAVHFDCTRDKSRLHTNVFRKGERHAIEDIIDLAEYFPGGGTLFEPALDRAKDFIMEDEDFHKADIIFITDGESA
ncbi:hypothetical protein H8D85_01950, partial [bacterium]|nr:hypothetical protein [bacterium]